MFALPNFEHVTPLSSGRSYATILIPNYDGGFVRVTSLINVDGTFDTGDIMVHLPGMAFTAESKDMIIIQ